jgi:hypothetical protein
MHRVAAALLLCVFSFTLIGPVLFARQESKLPACCRKDGRHHCSMANMGASSSESSGPNLQAANSRCPVYPSNGVAPAMAKAGVPTLAAEFFAGVVSHPAGHAQTEARRRVSLSRACQKRGPPSLFS